VTGQNPSDEPAEAELDGLPAPVDYTTAPLQDPWAHRRTEPRAFAAFWLAYLVATFGVSAGSAGGLGLVAFDVYRQVARTSLVLASIGVGVLWPLIRLSQARPERIGRSALADLIVVVLPLGVVSLSQSLGWLADWPLAVTLRVWVAFGAWAVWIAVLIAVAQSRGWPPWFAMAVCLCLSFGGAIFGLHTARPPLVDADSIRLSDMLSIPTAVLELTRDRSWTGQSASVGLRHWLVVVPPAILLALWGLAAAVVPVRKRA